MNSIDGIGGVPGGRAPVSPKAVAGPTETPAASFRDVLRSVESGATPGEPTGESGALRRVRDLVRDYRDQGLERSEYFGRTVETLLEELHGPALDAEGRAALAAEIIELEPLRRHFERLITRLEQEG